jgi:HAD superfamily hydrolase (TIGR01548 family)
VNPCEVLVFDIDGVLVDVSDSYRETIQRTVEEYTGVRVSREQIQDYKNRGGWNDDWMLSHRLITEQGVEVAFEDVVERFNRLFLGDGSDGLILCERWIGAQGLFERLAEKARLAIFTGRRMYEVEPTLRRFAPAIAFDPIVTAEKVARLKPAPDGLEQIAAACPGKSLWYVGDTVDDGLSAQSAGVPFVGIADPSNPRHRDLVRALQGAGAVAVLDDINQLESVLLL